MIKLTLIIILTVFVLTCTPVQKAVNQPEQEDTPSEQTAEPVAELTFTFTRQSGFASNQYAVWIEDSQGKYVKTLYASRWTANGGYERRPTSIPLWVKQSDLANMPGARIDAISGATPGTGAVAHKWDGTDANGAPVPDGNYTLILEGTLRWENQVYYRAPIALGQGAATPQISVTYEDGGRNTAERVMIRDVVLMVLR